MTLCFDFMCFEALVLIKRSKFSNNLVLFVICLKYPVSGRISGRITGIRHPPDIRPDIRYLVFKMAGYLAKLLSGPSLFHSYHFHTYSFSYNENLYIIDLLQEGIHISCYSCHVELIPLPYVSKSKHVSSSLGTCYRQLGQK